MNDTINQQIINAITPYQPQEIALFGSYARNEASTLSDIDVLVSFKNAITLFDIARIINTIKNNHGITIDLVEKEGLSNDFLNAIAPDLIYIFSDVHRSA